MVQSSHFFVGFCAGDILLSTGVDVEFQFPPGFCSNHGGRQLWLIPLPDVWRQPNQAHIHHPHTMGNAAYTWFGLIPLGAQAVRVFLHNNLYYTSRNMQM
jgi:hypothetical protein